MFKKLFAGVVTCALLIGLVPSSAYAANTVDINALSPDKPLTAVELDKELISEMKAQLHPPIQTFAFGDSGYEYRENESNDIMDEADLLEDNFTVYGEVSGDDIDVFAFQQYGHHSVELLLLGETYGVTGGLYDRNGSLIKQFDYYGYSDGLHANGLKINLPSNYWDVDFYYVGIEEVYGDSSLYGIYYNTSQYRSDPSPFLDVISDYYYHEPVLWAYENDITSGTDALHFSPNDQCTRGQVVTFLWRAFGSPEPETSSNPFRDINPGDYYYKPVLWAVENGITSGTGAGRFSPNDICTRGQVATFLWRADGENLPSSSQNPFYDVIPSAYYYTSVLWAVENGITTGTGAGRFSPNDICTRGQVVTFLYRAL